MEFESVAANLRESFRVVAAHRAAGELQEMDGVSIASAGVAFQMFNAAFLSAPVVSEGTMDLRVGAAAVHFAARGDGRRALGGPRPGRAFVVLPGLAGLPHAAEAAIRSPQAQSLAGRGTA